MSIVEVFEESGISGTVEGMERPTLRRMFDALKTSGVKTVICERADRIARDLLVGELILAECRKISVTVITSEGTNLSDDTSPERVLIRQIMSSVAHFDRACIVHKLKAARDRASAALGHRVEGKKPFGTKLGEAEALARLQQLRQMPRQSYAAIAGRMNQEGYPTRSGRPWAASSVQDILKRTA